MSDRLRMSFRILLTARTDRLPTSCLCSSACARARAHLVLTLECSWPCSRARALVLVRASASYVQTSQISISRPFAFCSGCCCKIVTRRGQFFPLTPRLALFRSTPNLPGTQQQLQQQHLRPHQQECGSAAAPPTARMRRVQQPMLLVSSSICGDYVVLVCYVFVL